MSTTSPAFSTVPPAERVALTNESVTGPPGEEMLRLANMSRAANIEMLDNATGAGITTQRLLDMASQDSTPHIKQIVAGDIDERMLVFVSNKKRSSIEANPASYWTKVQPEKIDQQSVPYPNESFTHVFNNFGIFFCRSDSEALSETFRVLRPSGTAGFTSWKSIAWWSEIAQPAMAKMIPEAPPLPSPSGLFPTSGWMDGASIKAKLENAGFADVRVSEYAFTPQVEAKDFAEATGVLVKAVAGRVWPAGVFAQFADQIEPVLLRYLEDNYPRGHWTGTMVAIISLGKK